MFEVAIVKENCRLCQKYLGSVLLDSTITNFISEIARIDVSISLYPHLPQHICLQCHNTILETIKYIEKVQTVDKYLKNLQQNYFQPLISCINTSDKKIEDDLSTELPVITPSFKCCICSRTFSRSTSYKNHKKVHHELYCAKCKLFFNQPEESDRHKCQLKKGKTKKQKDKIAKPDLFVPDLNLSTKELHCEKCDQDFEDANLYTAHLKTHNNFTCNEESCLKMYTTAYSLKIHKLIHEGKRSFLCVSCGKDFISKKSLICHEKIHAPVKAHHCDTCNISFSVRSNFRAHIKRYHEGVRYHCSQCPREFLTKCNLDRHEKIHTGVKDFKCTECISAFYTKKELLKHQRYHQGLKQHKCDQCFKTFFERHHLIVHLRSHSGERPYICEISGCSKSFYDNQKLKRHQKAVHSLK